MTRQTFAYAAVLLLAAAESYGQANPQASAVSLTSIPTYARSVTTQKGEVLPSTRSSSSPTRLLFATVFSVAGFDTEITLSNTSQDTLGSTPQAGTCTLNYYGSSSPPAATTVSIAAGKQLVFNLSQGGGGAPAVPNFTGYVIATCAFPLARGSAKVFGSTSLAFSQDAQVITTPRSTSSPQYLLFQFATNQAGFDTGIAIANTSLDPLGTTPTAGACTLNFYGAFAAGGTPAPVSTGTIAAGTVYTAIVSILAPTFQGYVVASCNFTGAAGIGFVSDVGARNVAVSETPEVLSLPRGTTPKPLLFSSVSNQSGMDTGIIISNTSADPAGTATASGTCALNFYGANAPSAFTTPTIAAGSVYPTVISSIAPGFRGYVTAVCTFPHSRGLAFTTPVGVVTDGDSETAEIVAVPRSVTPSSLLFSAVTNWNFNDTNISIANTSEDSFGTAQASGACTISYFGDMIGGGSTPAPQTSGTIQPGTLLSFTLSQGNAAQGIAATPGFRGYVIAGCTFPLARGLATVTQYPPSLSITKTHTGNFNPGQTNATYTVTVSNLAGASDTSGTVTVTDTMPSGLTLVSMAGTGWTCPGNVCTRGEALTGGSSYPAITVTVNVAANATSPQVNSVTVSGGGSANATATDSTVIQVPSISSVVSGASTLAASLAPGESMTIFGTFLAASTVSCVSGGVAPVVCGTTSVLINGSAVPLIFVSAGQVNFVVPFGITGSTATLRVSNQYGLSAILTPAVTSYVPAAFTSSGGIGLFFNSASQPITAANPGHPGEALSAYVDGLGTTHPVVADGTAAPSNPPAFTDATIGASVGGLTAPVTFAGLAPGQIGLYQVNFIVPQAPTGNQAFVVTANGTPSSGVTLPIAPCAYQLAGNGTYLSPAAAGAITITTGSTCGWIASTTTTWIHLTPPLSGGGNGQVSYTIDANSTSLQRSGTILIAGQSFTITQGPTGAGLRFVPVTPCRIADTRNLAGPYGGPSLAAATPRDFDIRGSACGIPATAQAYSLNLTVVPLGPLGFLSVWPAGQSQPVVSTLNSGDGRIKANAAIVPAGTNGAITLFGSNATHVIVDINGYFVPTVGNNNLAFYPLTPCRIADTRLGSGAFGAPALAGGVTRDFPLLSSACGIPATAQAYALNMTVVPSGALGFLSAWPAGMPQPGSSTLNAPTGAITANAAIVPAGTGGAITVIATQATNLIIDINGYFAPPGSPGGMQFYTATPCRIVDTRGATGPFGGPQLPAAASREFVVAASACNIPAAAGAYSLNATVVPPGPLGFLSLWGGGSQPVVSTLNAGDGTIVANAALVPASNTGSVNAFASNVTHLILDINGYFAQ